MTDLLSYGLCNESAAYFALYSSDPSSGRSVDS